MFGWNAINHLALSTSLSIGQKLQNLKALPGLTTGQRQTAEWILRSYQPSEVVKRFLGQPISIDNSRYVVLSASYTDIEGWWVLWGKAFYQDEEVPIRVERGLPAVADGWPVMIRNTPTGAHDDPIGFLKSTIFNGMIHPWSPELKKEIEAELEANRKRGRELKRHVH